MRGKILCIGRSSFLSQSWRNGTQFHDDVSVIGYDEFLLDAVNIHDYQVVINFSLHPQYMISDYQAEFDTDLQIAKKIKSVNAWPFYVMLSSRKVYGESLEETPFSETSPCLPIDNYGCNKLRTEEALASILKERVSVLRLSNVFGYERIPSRKRFMNILLSSLEERGSIVFDASLETKKDFLPIPFFVQFLDGIISKRANGIFNIGAGMSISLKDISSWVVDGFGAGFISTSSDKKKDGFSFDIQKILKHVDIQVKVEDIKHYCISLGIRLSKEV